MDPVNSFAVEADDEIKNVRLQLKALSGRTSKKVELLRDMNEFFTRQADIELQYARQLDGLYAKFVKPRSERGAVANVAKALRRPTQEGEENEAVASRLDGETHGQVMDVWYVLLEQMRKRADARQRFATNLADEMKSRLDCLERESVAASKRCLELGGHIQLELQRSFKQVDDTLKVYYSSQTKCAKAEESWDKAKEKGQIKKGEKMKEKVVLAEKKAVAARNEYVLSLFSANACKRRYYKREISHLVDAMDKYFHSNFRHIFKIFRDLSMQAEAIVTKSIETVHDTASSVSAKAEKEKFFKDNRVYFMDRRMFEFVKFRPDEPMDVQCTPDTLGDLIGRYQDLEAMVAKLDHQITEEKKTLKTIGVLRREIGHSLQANDEGVPKCVENTSMYTESYARLVLKKVHKASLVSQLKVLGEALGPNKPMSSHTYEDQLSESETEEEEDFDYLQSSHKSGSLRRASLAHRTSTSSLPPETTNGSAQGTSTHTPDAQSIRSRSGSAASTLSALQNEEVARSRLNTATTHVPASEDGGGDDSSGGISAGSSHMSVRRPAPAPPGPPAGRSSPRLGRSARRGKRPERPPDPRRGASVSAGTGRPKPPAKPPLPAGKVTPKATPKRPPRPTPAKRPEPAGAGERLSPAALNASKFGSVLDVMASATNREVPLLVESCIKAIRDIGMKEEGIFRVPGSSLQIDELKEAFERGQDPLADGVPSHIHPAAIAGLLKLFLRELADPVMTNDNYSLLIQIGNLPDQQKRLQGIRRIVHERLPPANRRVLEVLMPFLYEVAQHEADNKMGTSNLALVFGPTLMPAPKHDMGAMLRDATTVNTIMSCLIEYHEWIFASAAAQHDGSASTTDATAPEAEASPKDSAASATTPATAATSSTAASGATATGDSKPVAAKRKPTPRVVTYALALHDYQGRNPSELSFAKGARIPVHEKTDPNWWKGELDGKKGYVAAAYVKDAGLEVDAKPATTAATAATAGGNDGTTSAAANQTPQAAPRSQKKVPPAVRPRTKSTASMRGKLEEHGSGVQQAGPVAAAAKTSSLSSSSSSPPPAAPAPAPPRAPSDELEKEAEETDDEDSPTTHTGTLDLDARAQSAFVLPTRPHPAAAVGSGGHGDAGDETDGESVGYLDIGEIQSRRATLASERSPGVPPPPPPADYSDNDDDDADAADGADGADVQVRSRAGTGVRQSPRHISLDMTVDAATTDGDTEPPPPPPIPAPDYDEDPFGSSDAVSSPKPRLSDSLDTPAETPAPPNGAGSRLFETRTASKDSIGSGGGASRLSRAMSFGPMFAPPPPPDEDEEDDDDDDGDGDAFDGGDGSVTQITLPPPPPPTDADAGGFSDDEVDDLPPPPPPTGDDEFLDLPPPPTPDA
ncbi:hypothetical protein PTSG_09416 [Salpingoeca rosetta]|uniref:Uncharacterized protein n=1 Tax=Salpingoeca rosetta (strain ATCC 50818 / BSB-021) TaxID=946362 RepID=F2UMK1_SALR5|nr:uncharacterized protein PTSG_09416 [Salpingoeca rosetta]EGD78350.1 hypothetical protein PTSG_09416 [Salpingoeca rosetta]|eukprot:XP_004989673.1 hypothetical protein PTSG_09416 [Salpingoeca rosetta]